MQEKVELIKKGGETLTVDLVSEFECDVNGSPKRFVLLTANELDQNGLIKIFASNIVDNKLVRIESDDEWTLVKNVMRSIISSSKGDFTYTNTSDNMVFEIEDNYARIIAVQDSAKQALINDYNEKKPTNPEKNDVSEIAKPTVNTAIYPTENEKMPIGTEVVPGIAEMPVEEVQETPVEEVQETMEPVPEPAVEDPQSVEAPAVVNTDDNDSARDELVNSIIAAVDKYIESKTTQNNNEVQDKITKMQEELKKMTESLNA